MASARSRIIARRFGARAKDYDRHAGLQRAIAARLAASLPALEAPRILELGCGTGLLTRHLLALYPDAVLDVTDIAPAMVAACKAACGGGKRVRYSVMDAEAPDLSGPFDLIAMSMTAQWFDHPSESLQSLTRLLSESGQLHYATIAPGGFSEWRQALAAEGLDSGLVAMPDLPGVTEVELRRIDYGDALSFLRSLKAIGASAGREGYVPLAPGALRRALARLDSDHGACVTWRIAYGCITADG
ncbi:MAG: methyltransferase [Pseudomonadota bacterium]|nr:methyltransferase [Pseudomonadota bacterium]